MTHTLRTSRQRAFTLVELLVVIGIIVVIATAMLPAFGRIISSQNFATAVNSVTTTLGNARAVALSSQLPSAVSFHYDLETGTYSLETLQQYSSQATLTDPFSQTLDPDIEFYALSFRPAIGSVAVDLPSGTGVFGLSFQHERGTTESGAVRDRQRLDQKHGRGTSQWYAGEVVNGSEADSDDWIIPWVFPRSDPRMFTASNGQDFGLDPWDELTGLETDLTSTEAQEAVRHANSFAVIFGADGRARSTMSVGGREYRNFYIELPEEPYQDNLDDGDPNFRVPYDNDLQFDPDVISPSGREDGRRNEEIMLRAVDQLAVVDLAQLQEGVGVRRPWLARYNGGSPASNNYAPVPDWARDQGLISDSDGQLVRNTSRWIDRNAEIIGFNRYTGNVIRRSAR